MQPKSPDIRAEIDRLERVAEQVLAELGNVRRPLVVEFAGTPKAGKTSGVNSLSLFLRRNHFSVEVVAERASVCPIRDKEHISFNIWTMCAGIMALVQSADSDDLDVVILDRGLFDTLCWMQCLRRSGKLKTEEQERIEEFLLLDRWRSLTDLVFVMTTTPEMALARERKDLLTQKPGRIMNSVFLSILNESIDDALQRHKASFKRVHQIDTTELETVDGVRTITEHVLGSLHNMLDESVLVLPRLALSGIGLKPGFTGGESAVEDVVRLVEADGTWVRRSDAEKRTADLVQVIPICVFRHDGRILLLRRKEPSRQSRMHDKYAIWAGGHARKADDANGDVIERCLAREVEEELRIQAVSDAQRVGIVWDCSHPRSAGHLGLVHMCDVQRPEVSFALDQREFRERRGTSLSCTFQEPDAVVRLGERLEQWSLDILSGYFQMKDVPSRSQLGLSFE